MARANRHFLPGHAWHLTHRCHNKEFLLKFDIDRKRYVQWLYEAKKRYGLIVLNYAVTSNHVHLLVIDPGGHTISRSMQLIAGRLGQEYNQRKKRRGAFWEDRYHATAIQTGRHLVSCMVYIDLNMVRAGVVKHPAAWPFCGYKEIIDPPERYKLIDRRILMDHLNIDSQDELARSYRELMEATLIQKNHARDEKWTESLAVGDEEFIGEIRKDLLSRAMRRRSVEGDNGVFVLKEDQVPYSNLSTPENSILSPANTRYWERMVRE